MGQRWNGRAAFSLFAIATMSPLVGSASMQLETSGLPSQQGCQEDEAARVEAISVDVLQATLDQLYNLYRAFPNFIDVYYRPQFPTPFRPMFIGAVPAEARSLPTEVPVAFDTIPDYPQALDAGVAPSVSDILCQGKIRPGAHISPGCTLSFIFANATRKFASTAGHCLPSTNVRVSLDGLGQFGTVVFTTGDGGVGNDFALIQVDTSKESLVTPEMCDWAGPLGVFSGPSIFGKTLMHTGHGQFIGITSGIPPRPRVYVGDGWGSTSFDWVGGGIPGDSGSAVRLSTLQGGNGLALGTLTHSLGFIVGTPTLGFGTRWDRGVQLAGQDGITNLQLLTVSYTHIA